MFIRTKTSPNSPRKSVQICENFRKDGKVKQHIVHHVGIAWDEQEEQKLKDYAAELMAKIHIKREQESGQTSFLQPDEEQIKAHYLNRRGRPKKKRLEDIAPPSEVKLNEIKESTRVIEGVHEVAGQLFDDLYGQLPLPKRTLNRIKDLVLIRLIEPASKYKSQEWMEKKCGKPHQLDGLYRAMDALFPLIDEVKQKTFESTQSLFPRGIDLLLFDVTTLYFESTHLDELRQYGYSKDHRFNTTQVVLALATNQDGLPVGYELFEGNKAEVSTLIEAIESWKKWLTIESICFVGDRAMMSKNNIRLLEERGYNYIIAMKLRQLPKPSKEAIFDENNYQPMALGDQVGWVAEFPQESDRRLIVSYKRKRALKDEKDRQRILDKIEKQLKTGSSTKKFITNNGVKKYTTSSASQTELCEEKINKEAAWDGLHGLITNIPSSDNPGTSAANIIARYGSLWRIEEAFRINKHTLKIRPIFHWKPRRIHTHIALCYMTFTVLRQLQYRVQLTQKISIYKVIETLMEVQASIYVHKKTKDRYRVPGFFSHQARKIYKTFGIKRNTDAEIYLP